MLSRTCAPCSPATAPVPTTPAVTTAPATAAPTPVPWTSLSSGPLVTESFGGIGNQFIMAATPFRGGFVAVGEELQFDPESVDGAIWTSATGMDWKRLATAPNDLAHAEIDLVATDGASLVAVGSPRPWGSTAGPSIVWTSSDGASWRRSPPDGVPTESRFGSPVIDG